MEVSDLTGFHVYTSGQVAETLSFSFSAATEPKLVFYQLGAAKALARMTSRNVLKQSKFMGCGLGSVAAIAMSKNDDFDQCKSQIEQRYYYTVLTSSFSAANNMNHDIQHINFPSDPIPNLTLNIDSNKMLSFKTLEVL